MVPLPSCPEDPKPQHFTDPLVMAHEVDWPNATAETPLKFTPTDARTSTALVEVVEALFPSCLLALVPQQRTPPPVRTAQANALPPAIAPAVVDASVIFESWRA